MSPKDSRWIDYMHATSGMICGLRRPAINDDAGREGLCCWAARASICLSSVPVVTEGS